MKQIDDRVEAAVNEEFEKLTPAQQCALMCSDDRVEAAVKEEFQKLTPAQQCALMCSDPEALDKGIYFHISLCYWLLTFIFLVSRISQYISLISQYA